jgi:hypothetical protein
MLSNYILYFPRCHIFGQNFSTTYAVTLVLNEVNISSKYYKKKEIYLSAPVDILTHNLKYLKK